MLGTSIIANLRRKGNILLVGALLVLAFGYIDFLTGIEITFSAFYVLPIYLVTWHVGRSTGIFFALCSAVPMLLADHLTPHGQTSTLVPLWNFAVRLTIFLATIHFISELQNKQRRKRELERIFFHDILNTMTGICGFLEYLNNQSNPEREPIFRMIRSAADQVVDQIELQRTISAAESHELQVQLVPARSRSLLVETLALFEHQEISRNHGLRLDESSPDVEIMTDPSLLTRVLENMVKNALEAAPPEVDVTAGCHFAGGSIEFWVHNPGVIPTKIQPHIFQRSFSTKGPERGLGTFSMQLLSKYLGGSTSFISTPETGTVFRARYPLNPA